MYDVLVLRQHRRISQTGRGDHCIAANLLRAQLRHVDRLMGLKRVGHAPLEAGVCRLAELAERRDDRLLAFLDDEEAAAEPDQCHHARDQPGTDAGALHVGLKVRPAAIARVVAGAARCAALAVEQAGQLAVEVTPEFVEVGRAVALAAGQRQARCRSALLAEAQTNGRRDAGKQRACGRAHRPHACGADRI